MPTTKKPQDHKTSQAEQDEQKQLRFNELDGHELLKPFSKVKGSDQARLMGRLIGLGLLTDDGESTDAVDDTGAVDIEALDFDALADMIDYVSEKFALDTEAFDEFTMGRGGMSRAMTLTMAYAGEMGKDDA